MANGGIIGTVNTPTSSTATGVWQQQEQYEAKVTDTWPQRALFTTKSLRFNSASSDYLSRSNGTPTSLRKYTFSVWTKKTATGALHTLYSNGTNADNYMYIHFNNSTEQLEYVDVKSGSYQVNLKTNRVFRDPSAWYHIVIAVDTTQGTAANRVKIYVNGVQETSFATSTYPDQNDDLILNGTNTNIGRYTIESDRFYNGYMSEVIFIDGQQLAPTSFGSTNSDEVWTPIPYTGTYGDNGYNLQFENAAALGTDSSPNGNTFTVNNLTSIDQTTDTCTNNFALANPLNVNASNVGTFSEGNTTVKVANSTGFSFGSSSTIGVSSGKWYCEAKIITVDATMVGVSANVAEDARDNYPPGVQGGAQSVAILVSSGNKYIDDSGSTHGASFSADDILMIALDLDNNNVYFGKNGQWFDGSGNADESSPNSAIAVTAVGSTAEGAYFFSFGDGGGSAKGKVSWNFGNASYAISSGNSDADGFGNFEYAVPSGYFALCTKNLAEYG